MKTRFWTNWALPVCREAWLLSLDAGLVFKPAAVVSDTSLLRASALDAPPVRPVSKFLSALSTRRNMSVRWIKQVHSDTSKPAPWAV